MKEISTIFSKGNKLDMDLLKEAVENIKRQGAKQPKKIDVPRPLSKSAYEEKIIPLFR
ncbi:MAG: hypothetical protein GF375_04755 [Candidatus Omnitrophica bacterium]|nr:hypothetical protein [Candidatus Omnitrophota bacterium]MBD3269337.1 hypothetical protein [Candidatus Omnitrophota bacterium]